MSQRAELTAVNRRQLACTKRFASVNDGTIMNNETEKNDSRTEPAANSQTKRLWQSPEIEEVDFGETQSGGSLGAGDGTDTYS